MTEHLASPEQLDEYVELMREIVNGVGKGVRRARRKRVVSEDRIQVVDVSSRDAYLPGSLLEFAANRNDLGEEVTVRQRWFSALHLRQELGFDASRLAVIEIDAVRVAYGQEEYFHTMHRRYRFDWYDLHGEARTVKSEVTTMEDLAKTTPGGLRADIVPSKLLMDAEADEQAGVHTYRRTLKPANVGELDFDKLLQRTQDYGDELIADAEASRYRTAA